MCRLILDAIRGAGLIALLTVALIATGLVDRLPRTADLAAEANALTGGDGGFICGDAQAGTGKITHGDCPACHLSAVAALPFAPDSVVRINYSYVATVIAPRESRSIRRVLDPSRGMRAPPLA